MATEEAHVSESENQENLPQIQEKTISSNTKEQKLETELNGADNQVNGDQKHDDNEVPASENSTVVDDEKKNVNEEKEEQEDSTKAENVTSTDEGLPTENEKSEIKDGAEEKKEEDEAQKKVKANDKTKGNEGLGSTVAKHYNEIQAGTKEGRRDSRIFYLRNFNNWVKSVLINEYLEKVKRKKRTSDVVNVLDMACGKGGDLLKWQKGKADHVIMADIAATSIDHCNERYAKLKKDTERHRHSRERLFTIESYAADCTKVLLKEKYKKPDIKLDLTSCQFAFHYSFESYEQADTMLRNACENLAVGGYFIGTTPDAQKLVKRIKACKADSFGNSVFNIKPEDKENFPLFGAKYMFYLEGVVECPEFIVYLPVLEKMAEKYSMKLIWKKNFHDLFKQYERQYSSLLQKMNAMENYPAKEGKTLSGGSESQYKSAKDFLDSQKDTKLTRVGTLSADEWEVAGLYLAFAFEKVAPPTTPREGRTDERGNRKRPRDDRSRSEASRSKSRDNKSRDHRKSSETSSSSKRSKKDADAEEVYEVKDEIYEDETETKMESDTTTPAEDKKVDDTPSDVTSTEVPTTTTEETQEMTIENQKAPVTEETGTEVVDGKAAEEIAEEAIEETADVTEDSATTDVTEDTATTEGVEATTE